MSELRESEGILTEPIQVIACQYCDAELDISGNDLFEKFICPSCEQELVTPGRFGDFILTSKLGQGGMGAVFLAIDEKLGREVALKVTQRKYGDDPKFLEGFATEAQAMAAFNHPNVVQIYSFGQEHGQPYMVTEYLTGGVLSAQMVPGEPLDQVAILTVARDLAEGLQKAKDNGLIHGDIKMENVLFDERGNAKISDFGLARKATKEDGKLKEVWGTPYYIAPEKARKEREDHLSDQYSLGAALYHALAGHPPFDGDTPRDVVVARLQDDAPPLWTINPYVSKKTSAIIERMMNRTPEARYPTYASMKADFAEAIAFGEANPGPYTYEQPVKKKAFPIIPVLLGLGVLLALVLGVVAFSFLGKNTPPAPPVKPPQVAANPDAGTEPAPRRIITKSGRNDQFPFTSSQMRKFEEARTFFKEDKQFQGESAIGDALSKTDPNTLGVQWSNLLLAMNYKFKGNELGYTEHLAKVVNQKTTYAEGRPPVNDPVHFAKYLQGKLGEQQFLAFKRQFDKPFQDLAEYAAALKYTSSDPAKVKPRADAYASAKAADPMVEWPYALQGHAKALASQADRVNAEYGKAAGDKSKGRAVIDALIADRSLAAWRPSMERELAKYPKPAPPPEPEPEPELEPEPAPEPEPEPEPAPEPEPEPSIEDIAKTYAAWEKPAMAAAKKRNFEGIADKLGSFTTDDPNYTKKAQAIRDIYTDMPAMHAEVVKRARSVNFRMKRDNMTGKLIGASDQGVELTFGGGKESTVGWDQLSPDQYFNIAQQVFSRSGLPAKAKAKHLLTLAYLAKLENNRRFGTVFAGGARKLDPSLVEIFKLL